MSSAPPTWALDEERLRRTRFSEVRLFDEVASTNDEALDEARQGGPEGVVVVADSQTAGRGRQGRAWSARPGTALLVSVLLRPPLPVERFPLVLMAVGLAAADGVEKAAGFRPGLKWPNDLVTGDDRKLAGVLAESAPGEEQGLVVGVGINVSAGAYPPELAGSAATCEEEAKCPVDRSELLVSFLEALEGRYAPMVDAAGRDAMREVYRACSATIGRRVRVELPGGALLEGRASHVGGNGQLVVLGDDKAYTVVSAGDVTHLHPA